MVDTNNNEIREYKNPDNEDINNNYSNRFIVVEWF